MALQSSLAQLSSALSTYASSESNLWKGQSGSHLNSLCTGELMPKVDELKTKLTTFEKAQDLANELQSHMDSMKNYQTTQAGYQGDEDEKKQMYAHYGNLIAEESTKIEQLKEEILALVKV